MKKHAILIILLISSICIIISGCGKQEGDEFTGTWKRNIETRYEKPDKYHQNTTTEEYLVIERSENGKTAFIVTEYRLGIDHAKMAFSGKTEQKSEKRQFPAQYKDGVLEKDFSKKFYIDNGQLKVNNEVYERVSDKSMTFEEMNNGRGYPAPK